METPPGPTTTTQPPASGADSQAEIQALRQQMIWVLLIVIVISATLNIFFLRVWNFTRSYLHASRALYVQTINNYDSQSNRVTQIVNGLTEYGRTHPDFMPLLNHYGLTNTPSGGAPKP